MAEEAIHKKNKRFVIFNFWRNIDLEPVPTAPLVILSTRYDNHTKRVAFKVHLPVKKANGIIFPNVDREELIAFYKYDRVTQLADLPLPLVVRRGSGREGNRTTFEH